MSWSRKPEEAFGDAVARICREVLSPGPMGDKQRPNVYREFIGCGYDPALRAPFDKGDIGTIRTSCAVFARGAMHWAGRRATMPGRVGAPIFMGWLEGLSNYGKAWTKIAPGARPELPPGAVVYRDYGKPTKMGHVQVIVERLPDGRYITAEGGGGDGTECRLSQPKDIYAKDSLNRLPLGWWDPAKMDGVEEPGEPREPSEPPPATLEPVKRGSRGPAVKKLQERLLVLGYKLPRYGADGDYGGETQAAVKALIDDHYDGSVVDDLVLGLLKR